MTKWRLPSISPINLEHGLKQHGIQNEDLDVSAYSQAVDQDSHPPIHEEAVPVAQAAGTSQVPSEGAQSAACDDVLGPLEDLPPEVYAMFDKDTGSGWAFSGNPENQTQVNDIAASNEHVKGVASSSTQIDLVAAPDVSQHESVEKIPVSQHHEVRDTNNSGNSRADISDTINVDGGACDNDPTASRSQEETPAEDDGTVARRRG